MIRARVFYAVTAAVLCCIQIGCAGESSDSYLGEKAMVAQVDSRAATVFSEDSSSDRSGSSSEGTPVKKKIIYTATMDLRVEAIDGLAEKIQSLVDGVGGYISNARTSGYAGDRQRGEWTLKVPAEQFDAFLKEAEKLGEVYSLQLDSAEVTARYYALESRIHSKREEEKRMLQHLENDTEKFEDTLAVERELMRIHSELEQLEGEMKLLSHQTDFSTVIIQATERQTFEPLQRLGLPEEVAVTFTNSLQSLVEFLRGLVLFAVAIVPWLVLFAIPAVLLVKWRRSRNKTQA